MIFIATSNAPAFLTEESIVRHTNSCSNHLTYKSIIDSSLINQYELTDKSV